MGLIAPLFGKRRRRSADQPMRRGAEQPMGSQEIDEPMSRSAKEPMESLEIDELHRHVMDGINQFMQKMNI